MLNVEVDALQYGVELLCPSSLGSPVTGSFRRTRTWCHGLGRDHWRMELLFAVDVSLIFPRVSSVSSLSSPTTAPRHSSPEGVPKFAVRRERFLSSVSPQRGLGSLFSGRLTRVFTNSAIGNKECDSGRFNATSNILFSRLG